jgi:hypothetical protein
VVLPAENPKQTKMQNPAEPPTLSTDVRDACVLVVVVVADLTL